MLSSALSIKNNRALLATAQIESAIGCQHHGHATPLGDVNATVMLYVAVNLGPRATALCPNCIRFSRMCEVGISSRQHEEQVQL